MANSHHHSSIIPDPPTAPLRARRPRLRNAPHSVSTVALPGPNGSVPGSSLTHTRCYSADPGTVTVINKHHPDSPQTPKSPTFAFPYIGRRSRTYDASMSAVAVRIAPVDIDMPDSPPDLSSSRSSKSSISSFRSSIHSDAIGPENVSHFEDISLEDVARDSHGLKDRSQYKVRSVIERSRKSLPPVDTMRSIHTAQTRPAPLGRSIGVLDEKSTNVPARAIRPGFRPSPVSAYPRSNQFRSPGTSPAHSRDPSPSKSVGSPGSQRSSASIAGSTAQSFLSMQNAGRRKTGVTTRKTVKELEDEYHDSDEEVPDDAVIWNVPISPAPFAVASADVSPAHSRLDICPSPMDSPRLTKTLSNTVPKLQLKPITPTSLHPRLPRSATTGSFPAETLYPSHERHQSWCNALSEEARELSAALSVHMSQAVDQNNAGESLAFGSPLASVSRRQSTSSNISLPPIRRGDMMIDPLPISKEKEAVLARTRPSWLPPKDKKEERRHLREWEKMMALAANSERRRAVKKLEELDNSVVEEVTGSVWTEQMLPDWDQKIREPSTRELWWKGIDEQSRGLVWRKAIGNKLHLTPASYKAALSRANNESLNARIRSDADSVFSASGLFGKDSPRTASLGDVVKAYTAYRSGMPYQQALCQIAGILVANMAAEDAFVCLANILDRPLPRAFLTDDKAAKQRYCASVLDTLKQHLPKLYEHFSSDKMNGLPSLGRSASDASSVVDSVTKRDEPSSTTTTVSLNSTVFRDIEPLIAPLLSALFTSHLDLPTASRIWDVYVFEGDAFVIRAFVGVVRSVESRLYVAREEVLKILGAGGKDFGEGQGYGERVMGDVRAVGK